MYFFQAICEGRRPTTIAGGRDLKQGTQPGVVTLTMNSGSSDTAEEQDGRMDGQADGQADGRTGGQTDRRTDGRTGGQTDGWADR